MTRFFLVVAIACAVIGPAPALAGDPQHRDVPAAQLEKAKKAFALGKKAFDAGDFPQAITKFKESYELSKNPVLLYNIGFANESAGMA